MTSTLRVATDVGGTFTDLVAFEIAADGTTTIRTAKSDTTPPNFEQGVIDVIDKAGIDPAAIDFLAHGTTVVINALTERKGVKVGLITTSGFRDSLEIARGNRPDFFNLFYEKPKPFVPRYLRRELPGRMSYKGQELAPLDLSPSPPSSPTSRPKACRPSPSPSSTPTPTQRMKSRPLPPSTTSGPRFRPSPPTRSPANGANTSAPTPPSSRPMSSPWPNATSPASPRD